VARRKGGGADQPVDLQAPEGPDPRPSARRRPAGAARCAGGRARQHDRPAAELATVTGPRPNRSDNPSRFTTVPEDFWQ
jgi:hypothetical protein